LLLERYLQVDETNSALPDILRTKVVEQMQDAVTKARKAYALKK
jgi:hypothetical protein